MRKYLHKFNSLAEFTQAYNGSNYLEPWVSYTIEGVPTVVSVSCDGGNNYELQYQEEISILGESGYYLWTEEGVEEGYGYATHSRTIDVGTEIYWIAYDSGNAWWDWNDGSDIVTAVSNLEYENIHYVDYNKRPVPPFDGDLIIDASQHDLGESSNAIVWMNPNTGTIEQISQTETGGVIMYNYSGNKISLNEPLQELRIRLLNFRGTPYIDLTLPGTGVAPIGDPNSANWVSYINSSMMSSVSLHYIDHYGSNGPLPSGYTPYLWACVWDGEDMGE